MKNCCLFLCLISWFVACDQNDDCCDIIDAQIYLKYVDDQGNNWLDKTDVSDSLIKVFYKKEDQWQYYSEGNFTNAYGYRIDEHQGAPYLAVFLSLELYDQLFSQTRVEIGDDISDVFKAEYDLSHDNIILKQLWRLEQGDWQLCQYKRMIEITK
ncbi:MAG: hypothetical protein ACNS62_17475 [Candidatus Cyclobacteriaceae bacterium M3_2C_046]